MFGYITQATYLVGTHCGSRPFECLDCAERYYNEIKDMQNTYLLDVHQNVILMNTYGWKNGS